MLQSMMLGVKEIDSSRVNIFQSKIKNKINIHLGVHYAVACLFVLLDL